MSFYYSKEQKRKHVEAWRQSGLSQHAYCQQHPIKHSSFRNWPLACSSQRLSCLPVVIAAGEPAREIPLQCISKIHVQWSLSELITVLRALC